MNPFVNKEFEVIPKAGNKTALDFAKDKANTSKYKYSKSNIK